MGYKTLELSPMEEGDWGTAALGEPWLGTHPKNHASPLSRGYNASLGSVNRAWGLDRAGHTRSHVCSEPHG